MKYLLDTHTAIWALTGDNKLSQTAKSVIDNSSNLIYVSIASAWEVAIKASIGKADFDSNAHSFFKGMQENGIEIIGVKASHVKLVEALPFIHKDPFDRILVATAKAESMIVLTADENIHKYDVDFEW